MQLQRLPSLHAPILCRGCNHIFTFEPIEGAPRAAGPGNPPAGFSTPPPPVPPALRANDPAPVPAEPLPAPAPAAPTFSTPPLLLATPPPPPAYGGQAPGLPPLDDGQPEIDDRFQPSFHETILGAVLFVGLLVGAAAGMLVLWRAWRGPAGATTPPVAKDDAPSPNPAEDAPVQIATSNVPVELIGTWDARTDDIAVYGLELGPNGAALYAASDDGSLAVPVRGFWLGVTRNGREYIVDFVPATGGVSTYRFNFILTTPEAFTVTRSFVKGVVSHDKVRFVRRQRSP